MNTSELELCHHLVLGYDVEADNSTSTLALPGNLRINKSVNCPEVQPNNTAWLVNIVHEYINLSVVMCVMQPMYDFLSSICHECTASCIPGPLPEIYNACL